MRKMICKTRNLALLIVAPQIVGPLVVVLLIFLLPVLPPVLPSVGVAWADDSCFLGFARIQNNFYRIGQHYLREGKFWHRYVRHVLHQRQVRRAAAQETREQSRRERLPWRIRVDNSYGSFRDAMSSRLATSTQSASNYGRALKEDPIRTAVGTGGAGLRVVGRVAWDAGSFIPRVVLSTVGDLGRAMGKGLKEWWQSPGILRKGVRILIRPRDDLTNAGILGRASDFAMDPISTGLQSHLIRRGLQTAVGLRVPKPEYMATMATSFGVYGTLAYHYGWKPLAESSQRECVQTLEIGRSRSSLGIEYLDSWIAAKIYTDPCDFASILRDHAAQISDWRRGEIHVFPALVEYLQSGLLGESTAEEFKNVQSVIELLNDRNQTDSLIMAAASKLTTNEQRLFHRVTVLNDLLLKTLKDTYLESRALDSQIRSGVKERSEHIPFETMFWKKWQAALELDEVAKPIIENEITKRHLMGVFNPRFKIQSRTDFEWIRLAETKGTGEELSELMQMAVSGAGEALENWRKEENPHPLHHTWAVLMLVDSSNEMATRDKIYQRIEEAKEIPEFCAQADCKDMYPSLVRARIPPFTVGQTYHPFSTNLVEKPGRLEEEMDYWRLAFEDPIFIEYASDKASGKVPDSVLLPKLSRQIEGYSELFSLQARIFEDANFTIGESLDVGKIPRPDPSLVCSLFGEIQMGGRPTRANHLFGGVQNRLNQESKTMSKEKFDACRYLIGGTLWEFHAIEGMISQRMSTQVAALGLRLEKGSSAYDRELGRIRAIHQRMILRVRQDLVIETERGTFWALDQIIATCKDPNFVISNGTQPKDLACESYHLSGGAP